MKISATILSAALVVVPSAALTSNPWTLCVHPQDIECDITDNPPSWDDVMGMREFWAKQAVAEVENHGADPKHDDPAKWGGAQMQGSADAYGDACSDWDDGGANSALVKVCQKHADGNFSNVKSIPYMCFSNYMDTIMNECKGKSGDGKISGKLWCDRYGAGVQITT
ncbi:hypothetical protein BDW62DRAFT_205064 [Aspergillus aurantiobrunneus]